jgi:hypothetical protein
MLLTSASAPAYTIVAGSIASSTAAEATIPLPRNARNVPDFSGTFGADAEPDGWPELRDSVFADMRIVERISLRYFPGKYREAEGDHRFLGPLRKMSLVI